MTAKSLSQTDFPAKALDPTDSDFPGVDVKGDPYTVGIVERRLRVTVSEFGIEPFGMEPFQNTIEVTRREEKAGDLVTNFKWNANREQYYSRMESALESRLQKAIARITHVIPPEDRTFHIPDEQATTANTIGQNYNVGTCYIPSTSSGSTPGDLPEAIERLSVSEFDWSTSPAEFGYEFDQLFAFIRSPKGSCYALIPWQGVLICTCGDKIENYFNSPLCKHELAVLLMDSENELKSQLAQLSPEFRQVVDWPTYLNYDLPTV